MAIDDKEFLKALERITSSKLASSISEARRTMEQLMSQLQAFKRAQSEVKAFLLDEQDFSSAAVEMGAESKLAQEKAEARVQAVVNQIKQTKAKIGRIISRIEKQRKALDFF